MRAVALLLLVCAAGCAGTPPAIGEPGAELSDPRAEASYRAEGGCGVMLLRVY